MRNSFVYKIGSNASKFKPSHKDNLEYAEIMSQKTLITTNTDLYLKAWMSGQLCLHLSDTLPGLSFHPTLASGLQALLTHKGRAADKPCISLVPNLADALPYWQALPAGVEAALSKLWPGPLSVAWKASALAPAALVSHEGYIALRCPLLSPEAAWLQEILEACSLPFPSTSVNRSGEPAAQSWPEALALVKNSGVYVPELEDPGLSVSSASLTLKPASTLIQILEDGSVSVLREGALCQKDLEPYLGQYFRKQRTHGNF